MTEITNRISKIHEGQSTFHYIYKSWFNQFKIMQKAVLTVHLLNYTNNFFTLTKSWTCLWFSQRLGVVKKSMDCVEATDELIYGLFTFAICLESLNLFRGFMCVTLRKIEYNFQFCLENSKQNNFWKLDFCNNWNDSQTN